MVAKPDLDPSAAAVGQTDRPYAPSWIDRLIAWIEQLPVSAWSFYLGLLLFFVLANNARQWLDGTAPLGVLDRSRTTDAVFSVYFLALIHYLNRVAGRALTGFQPLLDVDESELADLRYRLTVLPAGLGLLSLAIGGAIAIAAVALEPNDFGLRAETPSVSFLYTIIVVSLNTATMVAFLLHALRQLILVDRLHAQTTAINLFQPTPAYAFSALTARTGIGLILWSWYLVFQDAVLGLDPVTAVGVVTSLLLGIASFLLPLAGMNRRLESEKEALVAAANRRLEAMLRRLNEAVDADQLDRIDEINKGLTGLILQCERVESLSTWPWRPETLRLFTSAVVLPVLVWMVTTLLSRFVIA